MKFDWTEARERIQDENRKIQERRVEREQAELKEREGGPTSNRDWRRLGISGRKRTFDERMDVPKERP